MAFYRRWPAGILPGTFILVVAVIGAALLGFSGLWLVERELVARGGESLALRATEAAARLDAVLTERDGDIEILAQAPQVRSPNAVQITEHLGQVQRAYPVYARLAVTDRAGRVVASTDHAWIGRDAQPTSWFQAALHGPRVYAEVVRERNHLEGQLKAVRFSTSIRDVHGLFLGVIVTEVDRAVWQQLVAHTVEQFAVQAKNFGIVRFRVLSHDGFILMTSMGNDAPDINLRESKLPSAWKVFTGDAGYLEEMHLVRQVPVITGYARMQGVRSLPELQWGLLIRADQAAVLAHIRSVLAKAAMVGAAGFGFLVALAIWMKQGQQRERGKAAQAQQQIRDRDAQLGAVVTYAADGIITIDHAGHILSFNPAAEKLFGYTEDEAIGRNVSMLMPDPYMSEHDGYLERYLRTGVARIIGQGREVIGRRRDGSVFPMYVAVSEMEIDGQRCFTGIVRDITERVQMVEQLNEREIFFRLLSDHLPIGVFEIDHRGACVYGNKMWKSLFNRFEGADCCDSGRSGSWLQWFNQDDREKVEEEWERSRTSFDRIAVECRLADEGEGARWVNVLLWPMTTGKGVRYLGTLEDITERKRTVAHTLALLRHGRFVLQTLAEARNLAELLAYAFPDPSRVQLGLTELLVNGVEHGNLEIAYAEKSALLEEGRLDAEMARRLALPENIQKRVWVSMDRTETELEVTIADDGKGFDWHPYLDLAENRSDESHGRGIAMSRSISFDRLEYQLPGNRVIAATRISPSQLEIAEVNKPEAA